MTPLGARALAGLVGISLLCACAPAQVSTPAAAAQASLELARDGRAEVVIVHRPNAGPAERLAAAELASYLGRMTGASFPVSTGVTSARSITLHIVGSTTALPGDTLAPDAWAEDARRGDAYAIVAREGGLELAGRSGRAVLYAAYDLLASLGVRFLAPELPFYEGGAEVVPRLTTVRYGGPRVRVERPRFHIRKLDVAQAMSQDTATLRRIVAWMPKARFNTLQMPMRFGAAGRVQWDHWREAIRPELERRGIIIEVGGHGYQNFLRADMGEGTAEGTLFERHPEWFGLDKDCKPSRATNLAFNTADSGAVRHVVRGVVDYLRAHPEIDIFDFWPPDGVRWAECPALDSLGPPHERQARLVATVHEALRHESLSVRLQMIAYANVKDVPRTASLPADILVDFCPIGQNFDVQIDDPSGANNAQYASLIREWRRSFAGDIGLYGYWRRYAWRSLPVLLPRYMQHDLKWYASVPLQAISTYGEPADWFTYELNHFAMGHLAWNPDAHLDSLIAAYAEGRFGEHAAVGRAALEALEAIVRVYGSVQYSAPKTVPATGEARARITQHLDAVRQASRASNTTTAANLDRLALMLEYAARDLEIMRLRGAGADSARVAAAIAEVADFAIANAGRGVFALTGRNDRERFARLYSRAATPADAEDR